MDRLEYLILKIAEKKGKFSIDESDRGEMLDTVLLLAKKGYLKNHGHSNRKGIWDYMITTEGRKALADNKSRI